MLRKTGASDGADPRLQGRPDHARSRRSTASRRWPRATGKLKEFTVAKIKELAKGNQPFFLEHAFMKVHADNFASKAFEGKSASKYPYKDAVVEVDAYIGEIVQGAGRRRRAGKHLHLRHLRQRPAARFLAGRRLHAVPRRQGLGLGRRRARARHRLLEGHDRAGSRKRRTVRPDGPVQYVAAAGRQRRTRFRPTATSTASTRPRSCSDDSGRSQAREGLYLERSAT